MVTERSRFRLSSGFVTYDFSIKIRDKIQFSELK